MWGGSIRLTTAMMFAVAFLLEFVIGGLTGVMFAAVPIDWQLTDTYFVVGAFPLCADRRNSLWVVLCHVLLVSKNHWADAE